MQTAEEACIAAAHWMERSRHAQAREAIAGGLALDPHHEGLRYLQAVLLHQEDRDAQALRAVDDLLQDAPEHYGGRLLRARLLRDAARLSESEHELLSLLRDHPASVEAIGQYAMTLVRAGQFPKARELAAEALRLAPDDRFALFVANLCDMAQGRRVADSRALDELVRQDPDAEDSLRTLAHALYLEHRLGAAREVSQALVRVAPGDRENVRFAARLRYEGHWSLLPLYPVQRWGWHGSIAIWVLVIAIMQFGSHVMPEAAVEAILWTWIAYVLYSWLWPPLLKRLAFKELT